VSASESSGPRHTRIQEHSQSHRAGGATGDPPHLGLPPAAGRSGGGEGIQPLTVQGIPRIDVRGGDPLTEQPVSGFLDGQGVAELIDRACDRNGPLEQHPGHPDRDHHLRGVQACQEERYEARQEREIIPVIIEPQRFEEQALQEPIQE
jgi:hypothetical protein